MTTRRSWIPRSLMSTLLVTSVIALTPSHAEAKRGFYLGLGLGYASVSGDTGIELQNIAKDPDANAFTYPDADLNELVRSDAGSGFAFNIRMGYNILGVVAIEGDFGASGNNISNGNEVEGQAGAFFLVKLFPFQFFEQFDDRFWDPYLFGGGGVYFMGYHPDAHSGEMTNDGRAWWPSAAAKYGIGCDFYLGPFLSLGIDLAFISGFHSTFHIDYDDNITSETRKSGASFAFQPTLKINFHVPGT
jgi:opacity protein-like surface antigen